MARSARKANAMDDFESDLSSLLELHRKSVWLDYAAGSHQTRYDYDRAEAADDAFTEARDRFLAKWGPLAELGALTKRPDHDTPARRRLAQSLSELASELASGGGTMTFAERMEIDRRERQARKKEGYDD